MKLKCKINNIIYEDKLVQGIPFSDEYNETLDSGTIILSQIPKIKNLTPGDDVYIYEGDFQGFNAKGEILGTCTFYKHLLVDQFTEERLNLKSDLYKYKIQLCSETKGLEFVQLPNISITQPLNINKKISIYEYLKKYIDMYSPKIKVATDNENSQTWRYQNKYKLSENIVDILDKDEENPYSMEQIFGNTYSPDFTLDNPNLRDVLAKLMIVKDRIPMVYNNTIYALDITKRRGKFDFNKGAINFITGSRNISEHSDNLKRTYSNALGQQNTSKMVEYLGFRNSDTALMKISDLRIETRFPIYKINKVYMCYYKKGRIVDLDGENTGEVRAFLCKQDITPLVKLNSERNLLSQDWDDFNKITDNPYDINTLAKYKICTVGYDIGSNYITGWGEKYQYIKGTIWEPKVTYVENIFKFIDKENPFGIYDFSYITSKIAVEPNTRLSVNGGDLKDVISVFTNDSLRLKGFFFIVEYDAFYNGTIIHTKDGATGDITINDNSSSSLTLLEMDGLAQKEKINRFGNKNYIIPARYTNINDLQPLGSHYNDEEDDIIIYHREYSINENVINCTYYGMKDYVLKNYFTSVYAKHRPYSLMSYGESITRAENKKKFFYISKNKKLFEHENKELNFQKFENDDYLDKVFSFIKKSPIPSGKNDFVRNDKINYGYIEMKGPIYDENGNVIDYIKNKYASDLNAFVSGNSLCFNMKMVDNVSMGVYVKKAMPFKDDEQFGKEDLSDPYNNYTGTLQTWHMTTDDIETGFAENIGFYIGHNEQTETFLDVVLKGDNEEDLENQIKQIYNDKLFLLPKMNFDDSTLTNVIGNEFEINKDNKEIIDMTFQLEPITNNNNDVIFSPWLMKLSDLQGNYNKFEKTKTIVNPQYNDYALRMICSTVDVPIDLTYMISMVLDVKTDMIDLIEENMLVGGTFVFDVLKGFDNFNGGYNFYSFKAQKIKEIIFVDSDGNETKDRTNSTLKSITLSGLQTVKYKRPLWGKEIPYEDEVEIKFVNLKISSPYETSEIDWGRIPEDRIYLSNLYYEGSTTGGIRNLYVDWNTPPKYDKGKKTFYGNNVTNGKIYFPWYIDSGSGSNELFTINNAEFYDVLLATETGDVVNKVGSYTFAKNTFVVLDNNYLNKNSIYNEYKVLQPEENFYDIEQQRQDFLKKLTKLDISECFSVDYEDDGSSYIYIDLKNINSDTKSIQYWYLDNIINGENIDMTNASYKFVFGVNIKEEDIEKGYIKLYISQVSFLNEKVYDKNYNLIGNVTNFTEEGNVLYSPSTRRLYNNVTFTLPYSFLETILKNGIESQKILIHTEAIYRGEKVSGDAYYTIYAENNFMILNKIDDGIVWKPSALAFEANQEKTKLICNVGLVNGTSESYGYTNLSIWAFDVRINGAKYYGLDQYYTLFGEEKYKEEIPKEEGGIPGSGGSGSGGSIPVDPNNPTYPKPEIPIPELDIPKVFVDKNGLATWSTVENAIGYMYQIDNDIAVAEGWEIQLQDKQFIKVKALGDGVNYKDSGWSEPVTYNAIYEMFRYSSCPSVLFYSGLNSGYVGQGTGYTYNTYENELNLEEIVNQTDYSEMGANFAIIEVWFSGTIPLGSQINFEMKGVFGLSFNNTGIWINFDPNGDSYQYIYPDEQITTISIKIPLEHINGAYLKRKVD